MTLDAALITKINTPVIGKGAPAVLGFGTPGINAVAVTNDVTGDSFFDPSAPLSLTPETEGGMGSYGQNGESFGQAGSPMTTEPSPTLTVVSWFEGTNGTPGGAGGGGAASSLDIGDDSIGSAVSPYGGSVLVEADAQGGGGWSGGQGGVGGGAGLAEQVGSPATELFEGSAGGDAGAAAPGGPGGGATLTISGVSEVGLAGTKLLLEANGGGGGTGGYGAEGGDGDSPGATSAGAAGGAGGSAVVDFTDNNISEQGTLTLELLAGGGSGGNGGGGGGGGPSGFGENAGLHGTANPYTATITYSQSSSGGAGGSSGLPVVDASGNTITAPSAFVVFSADAGYGGGGGAGGDPVKSGQDIDASGDITNIFGSPTGATGAQGKSVLGRISITDNTITTASSLELYIQIQAAEGAAQPLNGGAGGNLVFAGNTLIGGGAATLDLVQVGPGATIDDLNGVLSVNGSAANSLSGFSVFDLASDDTFVAPSGTLVTASVTVVVAADPDTIVLTPGHASIDLDGATTANTLLQFRGYGSALDNLGQLSADTTQSDGGTTVEVAGDGAVILPTGWAPSASDAQFTAACFAAGTHITTIGGEVAVERLAEGDRVRTIRGEARDVLWIGHRRIDCRRHPEAEKVWPVRIAAGAFGGGRPARDLRLSPDHAVFTGDVLVPIRYLINGATVVQEAVEQISYFHVELDRHDVLLAERLPVESYLDTGNRAAFDNGGAAVQLHADFALEVWAADACAKLVVAGPLLDAQRKQLLARAAALGHRLSAEPRLRVYADGRRLTLRRTGADMLARLPPGTREVGLISRSAVPAWMLPGSNDHRRLGVAVTAVRVDDADLPDAAFGAGWHAREPGLRWTNGDAVLALNGGGRLAIRLAPLLRYWQHAEAAGVAVGR